MSAFNPYQDARTRSISQPYDSRSFSASFPRKNTPSPLDLQKTPPSQYPDVSRQRNRGASSPGLLTPRSQTSGYGLRTASSEGFTSEEDELFTPMAYYSSSSTSPVLSSNSSVNSRGKSPNRVAFAEEPVSRIHTPKAADPGKRDTKAALKGFFGWKRRSGGGAVKEEEPRDRARQTHVDRDEPRPIFTRNALPVKRDVMSMFETRPEPLVKSGPVFPLPPPERPLPEQPMPRAEFARRRTTSASPSTNNRVTSIVQRSGSESSFSVHSEHGIETWSGDLGLGEKEEQAQAVESPKLIEPKSLHKDPRISIMLPGSSFDLGLEFGLISGSYSSGLSQLAGEVEKRNVSPIAEDEEGSVTPVMPTSAAGFARWGSCTREPVPKRSYSTRGQTSSRRTLSINTSGSYANSNPSSPTGSSSSTGTNLTPSSANSLSADSWSTFRMPLVVDLNSTLLTQSTSFHNKHHYNRFSSPSPVGASQTASTSVDSPTLPTDRAPRDSVYGGLEEPPIIQSPAHDVERMMDAELEHDNLPAESNQPKRRIRNRMQSSGSIASLLSMTFGTDQAEGEDLPMLRVTPATPLGKAVEFQARDQPAGEEQTLFKFRAKPLRLEEEEAGDTPSVLEGVEFRSPATLQQTGNLGESIFLPEIVLPEIKPLVLKKRTQHSGSFQSTDSLNSVAGSSSTESFNMQSSTSPSLTSMSTMNSNSSLSTLGDMDDVLDNMLSSLQSESGYDPLDEERRMIDEQLKSWSNLSLKAKSMRESHEAIYGLGLDMPDSRSVTPTNWEQLNNVQAPKPNYDQAKTEPAEIITTPRPDRSEHGFAALDRFTYHARHVSSQSAESRRSVVSSFGSSGSVTDTDTDSLSDIQDLDSASIGVVASKHSATFASPRRMEFSRSTSTFVDSYFEDLAAETADDYAARWDDAEEDEEIGWAM